ncbi:hypothetical protein [Intestinimonas butyriciproducens]|uniref:Transglutaminase superfamily protein n=1 Tax=Intestinimonas butyriciproducens TaxID=1297617 RepID=A0A0S2W295_9FIRM|nr:hypothetical protein [Intestinimonas butyriciproducens]ALP93461.1 hypothetical protein IB211_01068c [Intestinimonas butyriciproducens]
MKKRLFALCLCLSLSLTGCAAMLERDYLSVTPHARLPAAADDSTTVWVETYPELVDAIFSLVSEHRESGVIRLRNWKGNVRQNLSDACDEVSHDDPLGAYAVDRIKPEFVRIATYYEATVSIDYRRTAEQVASVNTVAGSGAIRGELRDALTSFVPETAFRVNYFDQAQGDDYIPRLIRQAYYDSPAAALGLPEAVVNLYPESGQQRVVEVLFTYPEEPELLREKSQALTSAAQVLVDPYRTGLRDSALIPVLYRALREHTGLGEAQDAPLPAPSVSGSTAYAALVEAQADSEGLALAYKLLCDLAGVECTVVDGTLEETPRFWTIVTVEQNVHRHVDPSRAEGLLLTDTQMSESGFVWDTQEYPSCGESLSETSTT